MRILFLQDNAINESLALTELAALLESQGHRCSLLLEREEPDLPNSARRLSPDLLVLSFGLGGDGLARRTVRRLGREVGVPVILAGSHPTFYPGIIGMKGVDAVCVGEAELPLCEYVSRLEEGRDASDIPGLWMKLDGRVARNPPGRVVEDLDSLPLPKRDLYYRYRFMRALPAKRFLASRGCLYYCSFCYISWMQSAHSLPGPVRTKSVGRVLDEIRAVRDRASLRSIFFMDDLFGWKREWFEEFCRRYQEEVDLPFTFKTVASFVTDRLVREASRAGCAGIAFAVETADERYRREVMEKPVSDSQIAAAAAKVKGAGLLLATFNMLGNPGESVEDGFRTLALNQHLRTDNPRVNLSLPIPGTNLFRYAEERGLLEPDPAHDGAGMVFWRYRLPARERFENLRDLFRLGCRFPSLTPLIRRLVALPRNRFLRAASTLGTWQEKRFSRTPLRAGLRYYYHCGDAEAKADDPPSLI